MLTHGDAAKARAIYQRRGLRMTRVLVGAMDQARDMKRSRGLSVDDEVGCYGIESRDEIVLEMRL